MGITRLICCDMRWGPNGRHRRNILGPKWPKPLKPSRSYFAGVQKAFSRLLSCLKTHLEPTTFAPGGACSMLKGPGASCVENGEFFTYICSQSRHPNQVRALPQPIFALGLLVLRENWGKSGKKSGNPESTNTWLPTNHAATSST